MPLLDFWKTSPDIVASLKIEQILSNAGDGVLRDHSLCSVELRKYLNGITSMKIVDYINQCLNSKINYSGLVLQDLTNELGRRLEYKVENGIYQGVKGSIGFDGIWTSPEGHSIVLEVQQQMLIEYL